MAPSRLPSDLVRDSKIETEVNGTTTNHVFYTPGRSAKERQLRKEEKWVRDAYLGQGAFGTVYRERCEAGDRLNMVRAVKEIKKHIAAGEELDYTRELEAIVKFSNDRYSHCFVHSDGWFETSGSVFISMEYLELGDLQNYLSRPLHESDARDITSQVLEGLQIMHENNFVHRDLKPGNIMVVAKHPWFVKIADFGISKRRLEDVTALHTLQRGTFAFAAPEVFGLGSGSDDGSYTSAVDMWSLGAVVHRILAGTQPFQGLSEVVKFVTGAAEFPVVDLQKQNISEQGQELVTKLMARDPKDRPTASIAASHAWMTMHFDAIPDEAIGHADDFDNEDVTISVASACWTYDETVTKLPDPSKPASPRPSKYQPPSLEDGPIEPDINPANSLPKDSTVVLEDAPAVSSAFRNQVEKSEILVGQEDSESFTTTDSISAQPPHSRISDATHVTSESSAIGPLTSHAGTLKLSEELEDLLSSYPEVRVAYSSLLNSIEREPDRDMRHSLRRAVSSNLVLSSRLVSCIICMDEELCVIETKKLRCGHRMCDLCLKRNFELAIKDPRGELPKCCTNDPIPLKLVPRLLENETFFNKWNRKFKSTGLGDSNELYYWDHESKKPISVPRFTVLGDKERRREQRKPYMEDDAEPHPGYPKKTPQSKTRDQAWTETVKIRDQALKETARDYIARSRAGTAAPAFPQRVKKANYYGPEDIAYAPSPSYSNRPGPPSFSPRYTSDGTYNTTAAPGDRLYPQRY